MSDDVVHRTLEYDRIVALPRRILTLETAEQAADDLTPELVALGSSARLRPWQAICLLEAAIVGGLWAVLPVGLGKTLISYLLPLVWESTRPLLVVPASLIDKTRKDFREFIGQWKAPRVPHRIVSREELALESRAKLLAEYNPDAIIVDESDKLANRDSAACRRIDRYVADVQDYVKVAMFTGTATRNSIMGYWHHLLWCLRDGTPLPMTEPEALKWASALDNKFTGQRLGPGVLGPNIAAARAWYRDRVTQTPGIVVVDVDSAGSVPLTIRQRKSREDDELNHHFERLLLEGLNPFDLPVTDPLSRWRLEGELGCGLAQRWKKQPPPEWRMAFWAVAKFVRDVIKASTRSARPLDTMAQVMNAYPDEECVVEWKRVKDKFTPETEAVWLTDSTLQDALAFLAESPKAAIVWTGTVEFGRRLAQLAGLSYYGEQGLDAQGRSILRAPPTKSFVASWHANSTGLNLQPWRRTLIVHPPQSAKALEQTFGRNHRANQTEAVVNEILVTSGATLAAFEAAISEANFARDSIGPRQKILRAQIERVAMNVHITPANEFRWSH